MTPKRDHKHGAEHAEPAKKDEPLEKAVGRRSRIVLRVHHAVLLALVEAALVWHLALELGPATGRCLGDGMPGAWRSAPFSVDLNASVLASNESALIGTNGTNGTNATNATNATTNASDAAGAAPGTPAAACVCPAVPLPLSTLLWSSAPKLKPQQLPEAAPGISRLEQHQKCTSNYSHDFKTAECDPNCKEKFATAQCGRCKCRWRTPLPLT